VIARTIHYCLRILCIIIACSAAPASSYGAISSDELIEHSKECLKHFARQERQQGIPRQLLFAVASTESGRWHDGAGVALPWPWTVNAEGKGYYFANKSEAIAAVVRLRSQGVSSIDVGCMQINLKYHPNAFTSLTQAFDPERNVNYAANFLKNNYDELQSWRSAVAAYHSRNPNLGNNYFALVKKNWRRAIELVSSTGQTASPYVRVAGQQTNIRLAELSPAAGMDTASLNTTSDAQTTEAPQPTQQAAIQPAAVDETPKSAIKSRSIRVIKVSDAEKQTSASDVMVVRPRPKDDSTAVHLSYASNDDKVTQFVDSDNAYDKSYIRSSSKQQRDIQRNNERKDGPRFIFY
jgi:hypothetical protein